MRKRIALCMAALVLALLGPGMALVVSRSFGLTMERERARALGGTAVCGPYHEGWRVFVSIPKTDDDAAASATTKENV